MLYDCFTFFNELEILKIRLEELYDVFDRFVLVEATTTFSGLPKPCYFAKNSHLFEKYKDKIIHVVVNDSPAMSGNEEKDSWAREAHQRNAILRALSICEKNDIIFVSDVDEIINSKIVEHATKRIMATKGGDIKSHIVALDMKHYVFQLNRTLPTLQWPGPAKAAPYWVVQRIKPDPFRHLQQSIPDLYLMKEGGWHFNSMGSVEQVIQKWRCCSTAHHLNGVSDDILSMSYYDSFNKHGLVSIDNSFPKYVVDNCDYYKSLRWIGI